MSLTRTLITLVGRCRKRVDMTNNLARSDTDFKGHIAEVYNEMHQIVSEVGVRLFESSSTLTATGAASYALSSLTATATGLLHTLRMARVLDDDTESPLDELMPQEEWVNKGIVGDATGFTLVDHTLYLYPNPSSGTYKLYWVPQPTDYSAAVDATNVDVLCSAGERFIVWGVALLIHGELECNAMLAMRERDRAKEDLQVWAANRAFLQPRRRINEVYLDGWPRRDGDWMPPWS